jgi:hypothetical protein
MLDFALIFLPTVLASRRRLGACGVCGCLARNRYLAASQSFQRDTEVVLLTTNLLKKEFGSLNSYDIGQALNCMMNIVNKDLARDLLPDTVIGVVPLVPRVSIERERVRACVAASFAAAASFTAVAVAAGALLLRARVARSP